jgi:hypothetical protein
MGCLMHYVWPFASEISIAVRNFKITRAAQFTADWSAMVAGIGLLRSVYQIFLSKKFRLFEESLMSLLQYNTACVGF